MSSVTSRLDSFTRIWWTWWGRPIDLAGAEQWLQAPSGSASVIGDSWMQTFADRLGGRVLSDLPGAGLVASMEALSGQGFDHSRLRPEVVDFYQNTSAWTMTATTHWAWWAHPFAFVIEQIFGRRVRQLALPTSGIGGAQHLDSTVALIIDRQGQQRGAAWIRTRRDTGQTVFSGCYASATMPGQQRPSVHVSFPLEEGNVQVFLQPEVDGDGSLWLKAPARSAFGDHGTYVCVRVRDSHHAAKVALGQTFHVFVGDDGVLCTDHELKIATLTAMRMHYVMTRK